MGGRAEAGIRAEVGVLAGALCLAEVGDLVEAKGLVESAVLALVGGLVMAEGLAEARRRAEGVRLFRTMADWIGRAAATVQLWLARRLPCPAKCGFIRKPTGSPRWIGTAVLQGLHPCFRG